MFSFSLSTGAGHWLHFEKPAETAGALANFVYMVEARG
jgi:pimeloyl-ACP methyl ester carboxylesterase